MNGNAMFIWGLAILVVAVFGFMAFDYFTTPQKEVYRQTFSAENIYSEASCLAKAKQDVMKACQENLSRYLNCTDYWDATEVSYTPETHTCYFSILLNREVRK